MGKRKNPEWTWWHEKKCAKCGKVFLAAPEHIYRNTKKSKWWCSWTCFNHKDEDKTNNFVENLEWCTASYNRTYGNAVEKHAKRIRGKKLTEEHKKRIADGVKRSYGERKEQTDGNNKGSDHTEND